MVLDRYHPLSAGPGKAGSQQGRARCRGAEGNSPRTKVPRKDLEVSDAILKG